MFRRTTILGILSVLPLATTPASTVLAQADRRVPGFEEVRVARIPEPRLPAVQPEHGPAVSKQTVAAPSIPASAPVPLRLSEAADRIPTMIMPAIPPAVVDTIAGKVSAAPSPAQSAAAPVQASDGEVVLRQSSSEPEKRTEIAASTVSKRFVGVWYKKSPDDCHARVDDDTERMLMHLTPTKLDFYETHCRITSTALVGDTYKLGTSCTSEGITSKPTTTIRMIDADTFTIDAYEAAGIRNWTYRRCESKAVRAVGAPQRNARAERSAKVSKNGCMGTFVRNTCQPGRKIGCYLPNKAGERTLFVSQSYEDGQLTYSGYRTTDYAAGDVRIDPGCRLP
jgi:hypothetical protein